MENRSHTINQTLPKLIAIHIASEVLSDLLNNEIDLSIFKLVESKEAQFTLLKKNSRLWVQFPDGDFCDYPYYIKNISRILENAKNKEKRIIESDDLFNSIIKSTETLQKKIFSNASMSPGKNIKDFWDEVIKKVTNISHNSHSLKGLVEKILELPFLQQFQSSLIILHLKGQTKAEMMGVMWRSEKITGLIEVKDFNSFFNTIKKSKIKSFATDDFLKLNIPFNGSFLAKEITSKKYSLVAIVSRHDFLNYSDQEIELFETCIDLLQPHFERLIDQEFSDKKISELRMCLKEFPLPVRVKDTQSGASFVNDLFKNELQDQDIFFNKKIMGSYGIDLYDSDELRHYAFDLFHFQRISLLGELLNTLRHELSNPLFGLKLSSQIFCTLPVSNDDKELMREIEKNIDRCQSIIENFSNLYQTETDLRPIKIKKIIEESLVLAKSEIREVSKKINYSENCDEILLNVPLIFVVQIMFNLIINAAQAMRGRTERAELIISIAQNEGFVNITVQDNGPGIATDEINNLFKPFFTTKSQGTGLGLVLSRNLALKMGGNLEYCTEIKERGACFRLKLPLP